MREPDVQYARSGPLQIAFQVVGDGPRDVVVIRGGLDDMLSSWELPQFHDAMEELAAFARVLLFDKRGSGLSDTGEGPCSSASPRALGSRSCTRRRIRSASAGSCCSIRQPPTGRRPTTRGAGRPRSSTPRSGTCGSVGVSGRWWAGTDDPPGIDRDELFEWNLRRFRRAASPNAAAAFWRAAYDTDVRPILGSVRAPTTVIRTWQRAAPFAMWPIASRMRATSRSTPARRRCGGATRRGANLDSTRRAVEGGDRAWRDLVERHHSLVRREPARFRGTEVDTAGDGFFATFDGPARAVRCAQTLVEAVRGLGLEIRAGVHTGECELADGKVAGIAVNIGARVVALAGAGDVLVTSTVKDLVAGSGLEFADAGEHEQKGIPSRLRVYRAVAERQPA